MNVLIEQYHWIRNTREKLFRYLETVSEEDYTYAFENFGWGSMRNLQVHIAECYQSWLGNFGLKKGLTPADPNQIRTIEDIRQVFEEVDGLVYEFLETFEGKWHLGVPGSVPWQDAQIELTPLWLYTHTTTHEFHHKGQIVSMSRQLGYIPDDTDLMEPETID